MSQIEWKKVEAEVKHLHTLLHTYIVGNTQLANNDQITIPRILSNFKLPF